MVKKYINTTVDMVLHLERDLKVFLWKRASEGLQSVSYFEVTEGGSLKLEGKL